jgi:1-acyl-sn-glycerol-3-phosphate acyltransferase
MLYYLVRPLARYVLRYYYRHIDISGLEHIPQDGAVILAANHPTAFIEPCLLACFQGRSLHFLARGDLYKSKWAEWVLRALHILPVYRIEDGGYGKLTENYATFEACYGVLSRRGAINILAEGRCIHEKQLRPLRKGTARIALGALEADPTLPEVYIVPVGVNFVDATRARSTVMIRCGAPLQASDYLKAYRENGNQAFNRLTADLRTALSPLIVQHPRGREAAAETLLRKVRHDLHPYPLFGLTHSGEQLLAELAAPTQEVDEVAATTYSATLAHFGIWDRTLSAPAPAPYPRFAWLACLLLIPFLPLWLLAEYIAQRGPKTIEFYSPVRFAAIAVGSILYLPLLLIVDWPLRIYLLLCLLTVRWSLRQIDLFRWWLNRQRYRKLGVDKQSRLVSLRGRQL